MTTTTTTTLTSLRALLRNLHIDLPTKVTTVYADADKLHESADAIKPATAKDVATAWAAAILNDRDPYTDPAVQRLITTRALGDGIGHVMGDVVDDQLVDAYRASTNTILEDLRNIANEAGDTLLEANTVLQGLRLEDREAIAARGSKHLAAWEQATAAKRVILDVDRAWGWLQTLTRFAPASEWIIRLAQVDLPTFEQHRHRRDPWELICAGHRIDLAIDTATIAERKRHLDQQRAARHSAQDDAFRHLVNPRAGISIVPAT